MAITVSDILHNHNLPHDSKVPQIYRLNIVFISITCSIIILRMYVRFHIVKHVAIEDYLMVVAGLFATAFSVTSLHGIQYGLGRHVWDLPPVSVYEDAKKVIQTLWICQIMYCTALMIVKLSIIASYHRIFPTHTVRSIMYVTSALIFSVWLVSIFATIFQCTPLQGAWNFTIKPKCISIMKVYYFTTAFSILTDLLLCVLPFPLFWRLKLPNKEKWIVSCLFGVGLFATVASIMKITVLHNVQSIDVTVGAVPTLNWSVVEVGTGIICACITCLKPLFRKLWPEQWMSHGTQQSDAHTSTTSRTHRSKLPSYCETELNSRQPSGAWYGRTSYSKDPDQASTQNFV